MAIMVHDCPHCGVSNSGFAVVGQFGCAYEDMPAIAVSGNCQVCRGPVTAVVQTRSGRNPAEHAGDILKAPLHFTVVDFFPRPAGKESPDDVPQNVERAFEQAAGSRRARHFDAACVMYRKAMELGLKAFSPDIDAWKIEKRIDKMATEHRITPELQAWAHELRLDGNEAVHGEEEATKEIADQMHEFCKFLLIYLYTLPAQVSRAQARRDVE